MIFAGKSFPDDHTASCACLSERPANMRALRGVSLLTERRSVSTDAGVGQVACSRLNSAYVSYSAGFAACARTPMGIITSMHRSTVADTVGIALGKQPSASDRDITPKLCAVEPAPECGSSPALAAVTRHHQSAEEFRCIPAPPRRSPGDSCGQSPAGNKCATPPPGC